MKTLLITFSDNEVHQDITFGMFESLYKNKEYDCDIWVMAIKSPKVSIMDTPHTFLVNCPKRPGIERDTFNFKELNSIIKWINRECFDIIFFETLHVWNLAIMLRCHRNTRIFQMIHDIIPHEGDRQAKSVHLMNKTVCRLADYIVLCNKKYLSRVTEVYGVAKDHVKHVDMWRRFPDYTEPRYTGHVLFFGRMNPYKGIDNLLEIIKLCPDIQFDVVGRVDPQVQSLVDEISKLPNVNMNNGYVSDEEMAEAFINSDWVILPYNTATQSGVVIDGYRYGRPCIAYNVGALMEQVSEGVSGFLVDPGDNKRFADKLHQMMKLDRESYKKLSNGAYGYGSKKYAADGATERFLDLIRD